MTTLEPRYLNILRSQFDIDLDKLPRRVICSDFDVLAKITAETPHFFTAGPRFAFAGEIASGHLRVLQTKVPVKHLVSMHTNTDAYPLPAVREVQDVVRQTCAEFKATSP
jgi:hypothetical protein